MDPETVKTFQKKLEESIGKSLRWFVVYLFILFAIISWTDYALFYFFDYNRDNTDSENHRSGLAVKIDWMTRCQYLTTSGGGITPRLDASGVHVGCDYSLKWSPDDG